MLCSGLPCAAVFLEARAPVTKETVHSTIVKLHFQRFLVTEVASDNALFCLSSHRNISTRFPEIYVMEDINYSVNCRTLKNCQQTLPPGRALDDILLFSELILRVGTTSRERSVTSFETVGAVTLKNALRSVTRQTSGTFRLPTIPRPNLQVFIVRNAARRTGRSYRYGICPSSRI
jgi:hypothetical protein